MPGWTWKLFIGILLLSGGNLWAQNPTPCGQQLSAQAVYQGVFAKSNGTDQWTEADCGESPGPYGDQYQCVEYVRRFYSIVLGVDTSKWKYYNADQYYANASTLGLVAFPNGGAVSPAPGDIVVFEGGSAGHVAIVMDVTSAGMDIIEQNWSLTGVAHLTLDSDGKYVRPNSKYVVLGWLRVPQPASQVSFSRSDISTGSTPFSVAAADFNGDGKLDVAVVNAVGNTVSIYLGNGNGTFQTRQDYSLGSAVLPKSVAVGDFNNDGIPDLAVSSTGEVSILLGQGDGSFSSVVSFPTGGNDGVAVVVGNFNHDGALDLAVVSNSSPPGSAFTVSILLGKGDGTLGTPDIISIPGYSTSIVAADFNHDGNLDLAFNNFSMGTVGVLLGKGNGTFSPRVDYSADGSTPLSLTAADVNKDGNLDLIVDIGAKVAAFLGKGDGTFGTPIVSGTGTGGVGDDHGVIAGEFNQDGKLDVAVENAFLGDSSNPSISTLMGDGKGLFDSQTNFTCPSSPQSIAEGDFNGDGKLDLVVANAQSNSISIFLNTSPP